MSYTSQQKTHTVHHDTEHLVEPWQMIGDEVEDESNHKRGGNATSLPNAESCTAIAPKIYMP
jgi:hypothetical protein